MFVDKLIDSIIDEFIDKFTKEKIVKKNLYEHTWTSGSSTIVYPITVRKNEIVFQWKSDRRIFDKFINRTVEKYNYLFESGYFWKSDGSCPSTIVFKFREEFKR